jgi:mannose-1-phosphate guanylyltransferase/mannose-6-phosphate isomerase
VAEQLDACRVDPGVILIEPDAPNTAPAALVLARTDPQALMLVAPSDHVIRSPRRFAMRCGRPARAH